MKSSYESYRGKEKVSANGGMGEFFNLIRSLFRRQHLHCFP